YQYATADLQQPSTARLRNFQCEALASGGSHIQDTAGSIHRSPATPSSPAPWDSVPQETSRLSGEAICSRDTRDYPPEKNRTAGSRTRPPQTRVRQLRAPIATPLHAATTLRPKQ